jgi:hypothetical protein
MLALAESVASLLSASPTHMPVKIRTSGCLVSIVASIVLTIALNLLLRACSA